LITQWQRLHALASMAAELDNVRGSIAAERAITQNLQLVSQLLGMLVTRHEIRSTSLLISGDYLQLRAALVDALKPFPEASKAAAAALAKIEVAEEIKAGSHRFLEAPK
jgi:hypothetical protein